VYVLPTRYGAIFFAVLIGLLVGAVNYGNNLAFLMTFLLASIAFVSVIHAHRNLSGLARPVVRVRPVFAGENAVFEITFPRTDRVRLAVDFKFEDGPSVRVDLSPELTETVRAPVPAKHRGVLDPGGLKVWTRFPLGLFRAWTGFEAGARVMVYPKPARGPVDLEFGWESGGEREGARSGPGVDDFKDIRPYQPGDPMQRIAWKQSSRGQGLMTKEFEARLGASSLLDWSRLTGAGTERKLSLLCAMVLKAESLGVDYGLQLPGRTIDPARGEAHKRLCLEALALFRAPGVGANR
jgi:uncharacterized protein (DUF58 family)